MNATPSGNNDAMAHWTTVCEFCVKEAEQALADDTGHLPDCPRCGATLQDRTLLVTLIGAFSESGDLRASKFAEEKQELGLKFGSIGTVFSQSKDTAALIDYPFRGDLRDLSWRQPQSAPSLRIPLMDHLLDALIVEADHAPDALLEEARRVLRTSGVLVIPVGNSLSIPGTAPSREADRLRAAGFLTHFVLPGATRGVTRQGALLLAISLGTVG